LYARNADIPSDVQDRFPSAACQTIWRQTWNDTMDRHHDEGRSFATAEIAGQNCKAAAKSADDELLVERAVKFVGPDTVEGLAIPFGSYDTDGEMFTKATDLCLDWFPQRPLLYHHGLDSAHKTSKVGIVPPDFEERESGIWMQGQLDRSARYRKAIDALIEKGALGYSSGAYAHLATKNRRGEITRWPFVELSLEPTPSHPATLGVHYIKSAAFLDEFEVDVPPAVKAAIEALDSWAGTTDEAEAQTGPSALEAKAGRVSAAVAELRDHARASFDMRAKAGRVLSAANRDRINTALASREAVLAAYSDLEALLAETDPEAKSAALASLDRDVAETLRRAALATL
jgi:hypothetical protein